jgi:hypothetical protein
VTEKRKFNFDDCSFVVELYGAVCRNNHKSISSEISTSLHIVRLRWIKKMIEITNTINFIIIRNFLTSETVMLLVYLNSSRHNLPFTVHLPIKEGQKNPEREVAIFALSIVLTALLNQHQHNYVWK